MNEDITNEMRGQIDKFVNLLKNKKLKVGDSVLCIKDYKYIKNVSRSDYDYVSNTGDDEHILNILKGESYLFEKGNPYTIINVYENGVRIESTVDNWAGNGKESQIFALRAHSGKYERNYFPLFSEHFIRE